MANDKFVNRHIGPREGEIAEMLKVIGVSSVDELIDQTVPSNIRLSRSLNLPNGLTEREYFRRILKLASKNKVFNTYIGMGWYDTITPAVILQCVGKPGLVHFVHPLSGRDFAGPSGGFA